MSALHYSALQHSLLRWWGWQLLTTVALALVAAVRYYGVVELDDAPSAMAFRAVMLTAHFTALSAVALSPSLLATMCRAPSWIVVPLGVLSSVATLIVLLIDTQIYQLYRFHINAGVMDLLLGGAARETFAFPASMYAQAGGIAVAIIAAISLSAWAFWRYVRRSPGHPWIARTIGVVVLASIVSFHGLHVWADVYPHEAFLEQTDVLPLRYAATAKRSLRSLGMDVRTRPIAKRASAAQRNSLAYPVRPLSCQPAHDPLNIMFIVIDSWRFDALNAEVTPNLSAFASDSVRFMAHHSGGNATRIGVFTLFYAIPGTYWHRMLSARQGPAFVGELLKQGYDVHAFRSAPLYSPEFDRTVFAQVSDARLRSDGRDAVERDADLTRDFISFLETRSGQRPFFALLFYDSPHKLAFPPDGPAPFQPSAAEVNYLAIDNQTDPEPLFNRYRNSVHYVDALVGQVLASIERKGLLQNTTIVVTGDHGQEFNDNGRNYWGHGSNFTRYQTGVPLILYSPTLSPAVHEHRTTHFDIAPTLMREHLGCNESFDVYSVGHSLFETGGREVLVLSEYADFAIVTADKITLVREQGMQVLDEGYAVLRHQRLDPRIIAAALEQKSYFHQRARLRSK